MTLFQARLLLITAILVWCFGIILPPIASAGESPFRLIIPHVISFYSRICHQIDARSFHLFGVKFAVCARCTGIYAGFLFGAFFSFVLKGRQIRPAGWWVAGLLPMLADVLLDVTGLHQSSLLFRVVTGGIFGIVAALILVPLLTDALVRRAVSSTTHQGVLHESET